MRNLRTEPFRKAGQILNMIRREVAPDARSALFRFGPDVLFGGAAAMRLPENATWGERGLAFGEDAGVGLAASLLGIGAGIGAGRAMGLKGQRYQDLVTAADFVGSALPATGIYKFPVSQKIYEDIAKRTPGAEAAPATQEELIQRELQQALLSGALSAGGALI